MDNFNHIDPGFSLDQTPYLVSSDVLDRIKTNTTFQVSSDGDSFFVQVQSKLEFPQGYICKVVQKPEMGEFQLGDLIFVEPSKVQPPISDYSEIIAVDNFGGTTASYGSYYQPIGDNGFFEQQSFSTRWN